MWERMLILGFKPLRKRDGGVFLEIEAVNEEGESRSWGAFPADWYPFHPDPPLIHSFSAATPLLFATLAAGRHQKAAAAVAQYRQAVEEDNGREAVRLWGIMCMWTHRRCIDLQPTSKAEDVLAAARVLTQRLGGAPVKVDWVVPETGGSAGPATHALPFLPGGTPDPDEKFGTFRASVHIARYAARIDNSPDAKMLDATKRLRGIEDDLPEWMRTADAT